MSARKRLGRSIACGRSGRMGKVLLGEALEAIKRLIEDYEDELGKRA